MRNNFHQKVANLCEHSRAVYTLSLFGFLLSFATAAPQPVGSSTTRSVDLSNPLLVARGLGECLDNGDPERITSFVISDEDGLNLATTAAQFRQSQLRAIETAKNKFGPDGERTVMKFSRPGSFVKLIDRCELKLDDKKAHAELSIPESPLYALHLKNISGEWKVDFVSSLRFGRKTETEIDTKVTIVVNRIGIGVWEKVRNELNSGSIVSVEQLSAKITQILFEAKASIEALQKKGDIKRSP